MPPALLAITGVIPFIETIFLWQSLLLTVILIPVSVGIAWLSTPTENAVCTARELGVATEAAQAPLPPRTGPANG